MFKKINIVFTKINISFFFKFLSKKNLLLANKISARMFGRTCLSSAHHYTSVRININFLQKYICHFTRPKSSKENENTYSIWNFLGNTIFCLKKKIVLVIH